MAQFSSLYTELTLGKARVCKSSSEVYEQSLISAIWNKI